MFTEFLILMRQAVAFVTFFTHEAALSAMTSLNVSQMIMLYTCTVVYLLHNCQP
jgi:hypothetical protein